MNNSSELIKLIEDTEQTILESFNEKQIENISVEEIKTQVSRFVAKEKKPILKDLEHTKKVIQSPIYIGMLGRYSHGKSALVNSMFLLPEDGKLPEGDGVVTSKVTRVCFDNQAIAPEIFEIKKATHEEHEIDLQTLCNCVGKSNIDTSSVDFYKLVLPVDGKDFARAFAEKHINLVDMPGLGGPYFKDQITTKKYIRELDMIIAVIKMDEVHESSLHIRSLLGENPSIPIIGVLTFADKWQTSNVFADCESFDAALLKAQNQIKDEIPEIDVNKVIAVSSFTGQNISELRELILNHVETGSIAISKAREEISPIFKKQLRELKTEFSALRNRLNEMLAELAKLLKPILPKYSDDNKDIVTEAFSNVRVIRAKRELEEESRRSVKDFFNKYKDSLSSLQYVMDEAKLKAEIDRIVDYSNSTLLDESLERTEMRFESFKLELEKAVHKATDSLTLDDKSKDELNRKIHNILDDSKLQSVQDLKIKPEPSKISGYILSFETKKTANFFLSMIKDPKLLIMIAAGVICLAAGCGFLHAILLPTGAGLIAIACILHLIEVPAENKRFFNSLKDEIRSYMESLYDSNSAKTEMNEFISKAIGDIEMGLKEEQKTIMKLYNKDAFMLSQIKEKIEDCIARVSNKIDDELSAMSSYR